MRRLAAVLLVLFFFSGVCRADELHRTGVRSLSKAASAKLRGDVTLSEGANITLTQTAQDIAIAATGSSTLWNAIGDAAGNGDVPMAETVQSLDWNTASTAAAFDAFTLSITNDAGTDSNTQNLLTLENLDASGSTATEALLVLNNLDTTEAVTAGILISSAAGAITTALDASDGEIVTALALGPNSVSAADGALINLSSVDASTTTEGLILPQHATACAGGTAEGQLCWEADADKLWSGNGTVVKEVCYMPRGHIWGLTMSNAADTANDITTAAGEARSEDGDTDMTLTASITKRLDAGWAVGDNAGGINTGAEANSTWYEVHLIKRVDTGVVDVMFTTTGNRATLPANYTEQRRIGWIRNGGAGAILQFTQIDDHFTLTTQVNDSSTACSTTAAAVTLTVPPSSIARFRAGIDSTTSVNANTGMVFSEIVEGNVTPALTTGILTLGQWDLATGASGGHVELRVSSTSTIEFDCAVGQGTFDISTFGWIDRRGRLSGT